MDYSWKDGSRIKGDVQSVGEELEVVLSRHDGKLEPQNVVDYARRKTTSELHELFEWDDSIAANNYRVVQAGDIIRSVQVTIISEDTPDQAVTVRMLSSVEFEDEDGNKERAYIPTIEAVRDETLREQVLDEILSMLKEAQNKLEVFRKLIKIETIEAVLPC